MIFTSVGILMMIVGVDKISILADKEYDKKRNVFITILIYIELKR